MPRHCVIGIHRVGDCLKLSLWEFSQPSGNFVRPRTIVTLPGPYGG